MKEKAKEELEKQMLKYYRERNSFWRIFWWIILGLILLLASPAILQGIMDAIKRG